MLLSFVWFCCMASMSAAIAAPWPSASVESASYSVSVSSADLDGDGDLDLLNAGATGVFPYSDGVFWYRKTGSWEKGEQVDVDFDLKTFANTSESSAYEEAAAWVNGNLDENAAIVEREA